MKTRLRILLPLSLFALATILGVSTRRVVESASSVYPLYSTQKFSELAASRSSIQTGLALEGSAIAPVSSRFQRGETLGQVLDRAGFAAADALEISKELAQHADLRRLRPSDLYAVRSDVTDRPVGFELVIDGKGTVTIGQADSGWRSDFHPFVQSTRTQSVSGTLEGSLEGSIRHAGGEPMVAYKMADVLQWDLDFNRDLRAGDRFQVLYETVFLDGQYHSLGRIQALVYENEGRRVEAYRFGDGEDYYDASGRPLKKMFLKSPLKYSRVTSRFSNRRFHPILKSYRPHYGVDYGAPTGTPALVTANGVVAFAGRDRGSGNMVKVRHPNGYLTAYLHLSRFASGIRPGRRVRQGEVIGYVGATGLATAPHLDYRVQIGGRWIDPMSLKSVPAEPIPEQKIGEFTLRRDEMRRELGLSSEDESSSQPRMAAKSVPGHDLDSSLR